MDAQSTGAPADDRSPRPGAPPALAFSAQTFSSLIGAIYDCAIDAAKWPSAIAAILQALDLHSGVLGIVRPRLGTQQVLAEVGIDSEWQRIGPSYTTDAMALWGGMQRILAYPLDEPVVGSRQSWYPDIHENRYFREILLPRGLIECAIVIVARSSDIIGYVGFNRHIDKGPFSDLEIATMNLLTPHLRRAVLIGDLLDMKSIEAATFAETIDVLARAIVLVDETLGIVHANPAAAALLASGGALRREHGMLVASEPGVNTALRDSLRLAAADDEAALGRNGISIPVRQGSESAGPVMSLHVLPLRQRPVARQISRRAIAAIVVGTNVTSPLPGEALGLIYDLTPAEIRVCQLLSEGARPEEVASKLAIARSTVRTHLLHIYDKTGCNRQVDLVRLLDRLRQTL